MLRILTLVLILFKASTSSIHAVVRINEVHPYPESGHDWIELYNDGPNLVSMSNWRLEDALSSPSIIYTFSHEAILAAYSYVTVEVSNKLNNSGDGVRVLDQTGEEVDSNTYQSSTQGLSWSRIPEVEAFFLSQPTRNSPNPLPSPTPTPTPTPTPSTFPTPTPWPSPSPVFDAFEITLNEIMACPSEDQPEWVELFNNSQSPITLENWRLTDWAGNVRSFDVTLPPESETSISWLTSMLNNTGDSIFLENNVGDIIAAASFSGCSENQSFIWTGYQWQVTTTPTANTQNVLTPLPSTQPSPTPKASPRFSPSPSPSPSLKPTSVTTPQILGTNTRLDSAAALPNVPETLKQPTRIPPRLTVQNHHSTQPAQSKFIAVRPSKVPIWSAFNVILGGLLISSTSAYFLYDYFQQFFDQPLA